MSAMNAKYRRTPSRHVQLNDDVFINLDHVMHVSFRPLYTTEANDTLPCATIIFAGGKREHLQGADADLLYKALRRLASAWFEEDQEADTTAASP